MKYEIKPNMHIVDVTRLFKHIELWNPDTETGMLFWLEQNIGSNNFQFVGTEDDQIANLRLVLMNDEDRALFKLRWGI